MKIYKFGGTSLGSASRIKKVADIIAGALHQDELVIVVSAIHRVTDLLFESATQACSGDSGYRSTLNELDHLHISIADELFSGSLLDDVTASIRAELSELNDIVQGVFLLRELSEKSLAFVLGFGERLSARMVSSYLQERDIAAFYLDARELIVTDTNYADARVDTHASGQQIRKRLLSLEGVPVVTGFIAAAPDGSSTTLGRGGSDYTASILGAALDALEIWIWTDVDGFFSADPKRVRDARILPYISYSEAMELSHAGARVLHPLAVQPAMKAGIPLLIKNSFNPAAKGTRIEGVTPLDFNRTLPVTGLSSINKVVLLNMSGSGMVGVPGIASRLFTCLARHRINIIFISQASSEQSITLAITPSQAAKAKKILEEVFRVEIEARQIDPLVTRRNLAMIAVVGNNMSGHPGVSAQLFETLGKNGINVIAVAQGANEMNISLVIDAHDEDKALNCIHESFFLSQRKVHLFIAGTGTIAKSLIGQISAHRLNLQQDNDLDVVVCGMANTRQILFDNNGIDLQNWESALLPRDEYQGIEGYLQLIREKNLHNTIFVDCTASAMVAEMYPDLLLANISVVTANKLGMAGSWPLYRRIRDAQRRSNARFLYETNVGAGLPIINTLNDLKNSGDKIFSIEGVLSGTLSFIFNELRKGGRFSEIVRRAKVAGYTEPDPRDDLSGADFARKFLILGRELGFTLEYSDVVCESLVPEEYRGEMSVTEFLDRLSGVDGWYAKLIEDAAREEMTIAYAGEIRDGKATIGVKKVPLASPIAGLSGSENMVVYTTERYRATPLVVRGPGAGGEVTAGGVFADILRVASYLV
ncbi:bifunctional aspartate kinase/homoserine dehydrogenase I [Pelodictyon phaeoclathratiforme]|jgi:aspartokinase/homoserine dehydrogenase 1|nr:bifunctional aspartate kinase/homoserine dehydrogenase I [Pelodictyon phaeoclathratiforme]MBV5290558.1 bifunctional aspartate kinase/homoserine dehydrogenase I [Pelodictyon phaeoclathratiforme]